MRETESLIADGDPMSQTNLFPALGYIDALKEKGDVEALAVIAEDLARAMAWIALQQDGCLARLRGGGVVFDEAPFGTATSSWQHVAFLIYGYLCDVDSTARQALAVKPT